MVDVKEAVGIAVHFLTDMYTSSKISDLRLEEVVFTDDEKFWLVTLSFVRFYSHQESVSTIPLGAREYKQIKVNAETGQVRAMVMRETHAESAHSR